MLAGGSGTRLHPMTLAASKQLLPVYDKPMVYYPLSTLMLAGIRDILMISTPDDLPQFRRLLHDGVASRRPHRLCRAAEPGRARPGLPDRRDWIDGEACALALGDNLIHGDHLSDAAARRRRRGRTGRPCSPTRCATRSATAWSRFDDDGQGDRDRREADKPDLALGGDRAVFLRRTGHRDRPRDQTLGARRAGDHRPQPAVSARKARCMWSGSAAACAWLDAGTPDSLLQAATFVQTIQSRQGNLVGCPEEVAFRMGYIDAAALRERAALIGKTELGRVLDDIADGVHALMKIEALDIPEVMLITPPQFGDTRGFFSETWSSAKLAAQGFNAPFVQDNQSLSARRRAHARAALPDRPQRAGQAGARDARARSGTWRWISAQGSPTYGQYAAAELSAENWAQLWVPAGSCTASARSRRIPR